MSDNNKLVAEARTEFGKGAARRIRRNNQIPAVLYGHGTAPVHVALPGHQTMLALKQQNALLEIDLDGDVQLALAKDIQRDPVNAMALNALGYTLSDRTTRYAEAKVLIEQAHKLNPEDPAVLDSLGWVNYRLGNLDEAERLLRQALERFPDQEVAAHLGEVLWANGKQREARQIWEKFLKEQPESPILRGTIKRLTGSETL